MVTQQVSGRAKVSSRDSLLLVQGASSGNSGGLVKGWWWGGSTPGDSWGFGRLQGVSISFSFPPILPSLLPPYAKPAQEPWLGPVQHPSLTDRY